MEVEEEQEKTERERESEKDCRTCPMRCHNGACRKRQVRRHYGAAVSLTEEEVAACELRSAVNVLEVNKTLFTSRKKGVLSQTVNRKKIKRKRKSVN